MADEGTGEGSGTPNDDGGKVWHSEYDAETQGWLNNRGMDKLSAEEALASAIKGHRNAEQSLGVPQDRRIDLPADQTIDGAMDAVYSKLGRPEKAEEYKFTGAEDADKPFDDWFRTEAHKCGLSANHADGMYQSFKEFIGSVQGQSAEETAIQAQADTLELKREWGATYERNVNLANAAVNKMGLTPEQFDKVKVGLGSNEATKLFQAIGAGFGEDTFVAPNDLGPGGPTTPDGARAEIAALKKDKGWAALYVAGDVKARSTMDALQRLATGGT